MQERENEKTSLLGQAEEVTSYSQAYLDDDFDCGHTGVVKSDGEDGGDWENERHFRRYGYTVIYKAIAQAMSVGKFSSRPVDEDNSNNQEEQAYYESSLIQLIDGLSRDDIPQLGQTDFLWRPVSGEPSHSNTPLHLAIKYGLLKVAKKLIEHYPLSGLLAVDAAGNNAFHLASFFKMSEMVRLLFQRYEVLKQPDGKQKHALKDPIYISNRLGHLPGECYNADTVLDRYDGLMEEIIKKAPSICFENKVITIPDETRQERLVEFKQLLLADLVLNAYQDKEFHHPGFTPMQAWDSETALWFGNTSRFEPQVNLQKQRIFGPSWVPKPRPVKGKARKWRGKLEPNFEYNKTDADYLKSYLLDKYCGMDDQQARDQLIRRYTTGDLLVQAKAFSASFCSALYSACSELSVQNDLHSSRFNQVANTVHEEIYTAILNKQTEQRALRFKTAWLITACTFFTVIVPAVVWIRYAYLRFKEPLRAFSVRPDSFLSYKDEKFHHDFDGISTDSMHQSHSFISVTRKLAKRTPDKRENQLRKIIQLVEPDASAVNKRETTPLLQKSHADHTHPAIHIIASNWKQNGVHQAAAFKQKWKRFQRAFPERASPLSGSCTLK